jgi:hypothetical protein
MYQISNILHEMMLLRTLALLDLLSNHLNELFLCLEGQKQAKLLPHCSDVHPHQLLLLL